jgi:hypothetical protein
MTRQPGIPVGDGAARLSGRQRRAVDARMSEVLGNDDRPPAVSGWTRFSHQMSVQAQVIHGQPRFGHLLHACLTILTGGAWGLVWWACWMGSARRRYQRTRLRQLDAAGLLHPGDLFLPGGSGPRRAP